MHTAAPLPTYNVGLRSSADLVTVNSKLPPATVSVIPLNLNIVSRSFSRFAWRRAKKAAKLSRLSATALMRGSGPSVENQSQPVAGCAHKRSSAPWSPALKARMNEDTNVFTLSAVQASVLAAGVEEWDGRATEVRSSGARTSHATKPTNTTQAETPRLRVGCGPRQQVRRALDRSPTAPPAANKALVSPADPTVSCILPLGAVATVELVDLQSPAGACRPTLGAVLTTVPAALAVSPGAFWPSARGALVVAVTPVRHHNLRSSSAPASRF